MNNLSKFKTILLSLFILFFLSSLFHRNVNAIFVRSSQPVIPVSPNEWDSILTTDPGVLVEGNLVKIWYAGSNGFDNDSKFQIGYATSNDGVVFSKFQNTPIIPWNFVKNNDIGIQAPRLLKRTKNDTTIYEMWFNSIYQNYSNFDIYYTSSTDGINWSNLTKVNFDTSPGWSLNGQTSPIVIYDSENNIYKMWHSARSSLDNKWRVAYATSSAGINWVRNPQPILNPDSQWENNDGGAGIVPCSILVENNKYYLFYHGDRDIGYAFSNDGINFTKYANNPILTNNSSDPESFDSSRIVAAAITKYQNEYLLYYVGRGSTTNVWQIWLAKSPNIPGEPEPSNSPPPSPTSTPTPTVTSSPTPTPTSGPPPFSPIIIIPGLGGSWNEADIFSCNPSTGGIWTATPFVDVYDRLIYTLTKKAGLKMNKDVYFYTYDWRQPLPVQSSRLKKYIDTALAGRQGTKVKLVGHSLGGLVIRSYLTDYWSEDKVESAMTVGSPHSGTLLAYPLWEGGEMPKEFSLFNIVLNQIIQYCRVDPLTLQRKSEREVVQKLVPVAQSLLPTFDYLYKRRLVIPVTGMISQNDWLNLHPLPAQHFFTPFQTLSGSGFKTLLSYTVKNPSAKDIRGGNWLDGKISDKTKSDAGDGTILLISASDPVLPNETLFKDHGQLISSKEGVAKILTFLNISAPPIDMEVAQSVNLKTLSLSVDKPVSFILVDPEKNTESQKQLLIRINPKFGNYRIKIKGERNEKARITLSLFKYCE